ncbi:MAG TPA: tetratricopeptide repeat protein [Bryobacteraceae bacterium]|jgi:tetratricopeptide (TPR) repeat protein
MGGRLLRSIVVFAFAPAASLAQTGVDQPAANQAAANLAYAALRFRDYDRAIVDFKQAVDQAPKRVDIRKDLGYTLLKTGETEAARIQFAEAMRLDPKDDQAALEYAFLCYETRQPVEARRTFDRLRNAAGSPPDVKKTASEAFENIDKPLREGIARWQQALQLAPDNFSAHEELARLAEQRDDLAVAAEHYERAWRLKIDRRDLLIDLARIWKEMNREEDANAALIAAWRGGTPRVSEEARDLLPGRYPFLSEFQKALALDPSNVPLQKDVAYQKGEPEPATGQVASTPVLQSRPEQSRAAEAAKALGFTSLEKGYLTDAVKYLQLAQEAAPQDFEVMLKLGWAFNMLKDDETALHWFELARHSPDPEIALEASRAYRNLAPSLELFRTTVWAYPMYSSRWEDLFGYAQAKTELRLRRMPFLHPYVSVRLLGDVRGEINAAFGPEYLSERSVIFAGGLATQPWHGATGWFEAGEALIYEETPTERRRWMRDYRGGVSYAKGFGNLLTKGSHGKFAETNMDGVFISRFSDDSMLYSQNRAGYTLRSAEGAGGMHAQVLWNANLTADAKRQYWANYVETGPGVRVRFANSPVLFSASLLRGAYLLNEFNPRRPNYTELRVGVWYAFTR